MLANSDEHLDQTAPPSSISTFARRAGVSYSDILRGAHSIGALLEHLGYRSVPSPSHPCPAGGHYFNGGYSVRRHCSADDGVMGFQLEVTRAVRRTHEARSAFASKLALALATYCAFHCGYSFALKLLPLPVKEAPQREAHVLDKDSGENRHGQRVVHAKANLYH